MPNLPSLVLVFFTGTVFAASKAPAILLGEAYPSGNVYLQELDSDDGVRPTDRWPSSVKLFCIRAAACNDGAVGSKPRTAKKMGEPKSPLHPASEEGMDATSDEACGRKTKLNAAFTYAGGEDFFKGMSDYCEFGPGVVKYETKEPAKNRAYAVIAFGEGIAIEKAEVQAGNQKRPASRDELSAVEKQKKEHAKENCTTQPSYVTDAEILWIGHERAGRRSWRLSRYSNPGCGGHMADVYVLDRMKGEKVEGTHFLVRANGLL